MATTAHAMEEEKKDDGDHSFVDVVGRGRQLPQSYDDDGKRARPTRGGKDGAATPCASADGGFGASSGAVEGRRCGGKGNGNNPLLLLACAAGITSCYLWYGTVQEHVFHLDGKNGGSESITLFLLATGTFSSFLLAWAWTIVGPILLPSSSDDGKPKSDDGGEHAGEGGGGGGLDHPLIALTSLAYLSAMSASNESLHYVSYPTCVLAKSSKLVPTMVAGWVADRWGGARRRRRVDPTEWVGAALITAGIVSFQYVQLRTQSNERHDAGRGGGDSPYGLALLGLSLLMDGVMAACQNALKRGRSGRRGEGKVDNDGGGSGGVLPTSSSHRRPPSAMETMLYINLYATLMLLPASYYAGQFRRGMDAMFSDRYGDGGKSTLLLQLNLSASLGQVFIFLTVHHFSPLTCTTITTTRKFFTILLSVYKFGHVLGAVQWLSVALVFAGLYLEIVAKLFEGGGGGGRDCAVVKNHKEGSDCSAEERKKKE